MAPDRQSQDVADRPVAYTHPAAREVAEHVLAVLAGQTARAAREMLPDSTSVATAIDVAFWGSLRREEGASPRVSLAFVPPAQVREPLMFRRPLSLGAAALARLAPAVEHPGVHLGVIEGRGHAGVRVWGMTRYLRPFTLVLEVVAPGLIVLKYPPSESGKFVNVVVLEGDEVRFVDHGASAGPDGSANPEHAGPDASCIGRPTPLRRQFGLDDPARGWAPAADTLVELAVAMRAHGRGGTLLVVPQDADGWHTSLVRSNPYRMAAAGDAPTGTVGRLSPEAIVAVAGLTAVDGATVLSDALRVLGFGAKIVRRRGRPQVRRALLSQPIEGDVPRVVALTQLGATRHLAAAQFVADQRDALALVASQDGRFTIFRWLDEAALVGARRVDLLLI